MSKGQSYEQLVGSYLDNEMSNQQRLDFENQLQTNAELRQELDFQQEVIDGIKDFRRLELKARLENIPIYTPVYQTIAFKAAAVVAVTAGIGFGSYFLMNKNTESISNKVELTYNDSSFYQDEIVPAIPQAIPSDENTNSSTLTESKPADNISALSSKHQKREKSTGGVAVVKPNVTTPDVKTFTDDDFETEDINTLQNKSSESIIEPLSEAVEVATIKDKKNKFHYKFYENRLYLLGNFDDMPYEIIEINSKSGKKFFLYYKDNFYRLQNDQVKPAPLEKIENDSLVNELKIIQMNKNH